MENSFNIKPIGIFHSPFKNFLEAPRQATLSVPDCYIEILPEFELGLQDLEGFDRIWVIFSFHLKKSWRPLVQPPRGTNSKKGVFATRSPLRPNHLGLSCLNLERIEKRKLFVAGSDLLDGTPVFDIKPYLAYADSFPNAKMGWLEGIDSEKWTLQWSDSALRQRRWLENERIYLEPILSNQLEYDPFSPERKRVWPSKKENVFIFAYRTWRVLFEAHAKDKILLCQAIFSGYTALDLDNADDKYQDKALHRRYLVLFTEAQLL